MIEIPIDMTFSVSHLIEPVLIAVALAMFTWMAAFLLIDSTNSYRFDVFVFGVTLVMTALVPVALIGTLIAIPAGWHDVQPTEESIARVVDELGGTLIEPTQHAFTNKLRFSCEASSPSAIVVDITDEGRVDTVALEVTPGEQCIVKVPAGGAR